MTQARSRFPLAYRAYIVFVVGMLLCYGVFGILPFVLSGAWTFSHTQIALQTGVPGYPYDGIGLLMVLLSGLLAPFFSIPVLLVLGPMLMRGEIPHAVRPILLPAMLAHVLFVAFLLTYGRTILTWILD